MRIIDLLHRKKRFFSLEFFPPKDPVAWPAFFDEVKKLSAMMPLYVSVTYGAGGSARNHTLTIVERLKSLDFEPMAHLTCVGSDRTRLNIFLSELKAAGIDNVLALRGDLPECSRNADRQNMEFHLAADLVDFIRTGHGELGIAVAGYPEKHPEAPDLDTDIGHLKQKMACGADFVITQLFFKNDNYFSYLAKARLQGIIAPIVPGILPVMSLPGLKRMMSLCHTLEVPHDYMVSLEEADREGGTEAVRRLGVEYAKRQILDLLERGAPGIHLYTLNRSATCLEIASYPPIARFMA